MKTLFVSIAHGTLSSLLVLSLVGCTGISKQPAVGITATVPAFSGWYQGREVYYLVTDISDRTAAKGMGSNFSPRLSDAVPEYPKPPEQKTVIEKAYSFIGDTQGKVFASAPPPIGAGSNIESYSPVWLIMEVSWVRNSNVRTLKSESEILELAELGDVQIRRTNMVINCPIIADAAGNALPGVQIRK